MQPMDEFLNSVESRLRCPAERRPSVMEELRVHLADQAEALVRQGRNKMEAEQQAVREMRPAWLLALRLSIANGWNVKVQVLRELWALGLICEAMAVISMNLGLVWSLQRDYEFRSTVPGLSPWAVMTVLGFFALSAVVFVTFVFSLGRTVRGWVWAFVVGAIILNAQVRVPHHIDIMAIGSLLAGALLPAAAFLGQRKEAPRLEWLAWASAGSLLLCVIGAGLVAVQMSFLSGLSSILGSLPPLSEWPTVAIPWVFWLGAWVLERADRAQSAEPAD